MPPNGKRPFLFAKTHGIFARFTPVEGLVACLANRDPSPALSAAGLLSADWRPEPQATLAVERDLQRFFIDRLARAITPDSAGYPLFAALVREYEIRNIALFLAQNDRETPSWHELPAGTGFYGAPVFGLARDTVTALLLASPYRDALRAWQETRDPATLEGRLERAHDACLANALESVRDRDRERLIALNRQRLALRTTLTALRLRHIAGFDRQTVLARLDISDPALRNETGAILAADNLSDPVAALPRWARSRARAIVAERPELDSAKNRPETATGGLRNLEKIAAILMHRRYRKNFHAYGSGHAPVWCFYFLFRRELHNIALLLNAIRFGIDEETFRGELVD